MPFFVKEKSSTLDRDLNLFHVAIGRCDGLSIGLKTFDVKCRGFADEGFRFIRRRGGGKAPR